MVASVITAVFAALAAAAALAALREVRRLKGHLSGGDGEAVRDGDVRTSRRIMDEWFYGSDD